MRPLHTLSLLTLGLLAACIVAVMCAGCGSTRSAEGASIALYHGGAACTGTIIVPGASTITAPLDSATCAGFPPFSVGLHYAGNRIVTDSLKVYGVDARGLFTELLRLRLLVDSLRAR